MPGPPDGPPLAAAAAVDAPSLPGAAGDARLRARLGRRRSVAARRRALPGGDRVADVLRLERADGALARRRRDDAAPARLPARRRRALGPLPAPAADGDRGRGAGGRDRRARAADADGGPEPPAHPRDGRRLRRRGRALPARVGLAAAADRPDGEPPAGERADAP